MSETKSIEMETLQSLLSQYGQQHLLTFWEQLTDEQQKSLQAQIECIDWEQLGRLISHNDCDVDWQALAARAQSPQAINAAEFNDRQRFDSAWQRGAEALRAGKVAFVLTAGGQGSRLGFDKPKGMYPIGPVSNRTLFQMMFDQAAARGRQFDTVIPIFVMTSPQTDADTREFLRENSWFGYPADQVTIFCQGTMPAVDEITGRVLMASPSELSTSPDGHGGMLQALERDRCLSQMKQAGIELLFYGQIDNPLLQVCHPALLGFHLQQESEITTQVVRKSEPLQKVGNVVEVDGRMQIIEYSDLPDSAAEIREDDGSLKFWAGSIAVHVMNRSFLERAIHGGNQLPFHRANKKVPFVDQGGELKTPETNNAIKFERFIFDLLPLANKALVCEVEATEGFAALKNAPPAPKETAEWVRNSISDLHRAWLEEAGWEVAEDVHVEICPSFAVDRQQLLERNPPKQTIDQNTFLK
ncbi:MAG: UTP--glucose-1-phosphate uridylyltransferase [Pirellulaceae bacterium]